LGESSILPFYVGLANSIGRIIGHFVLK
jgi:hypothetical protein